MRRIVVAYCLGVVAASLAGFFSPAWYLGFLPLAAGLVWAAYDLIEVTDDEPASTPRPE